MSELIKGFRYSLSGFRLVGKPGIRLYILVPLFINTAIFSLLILYGLMQFSEFVNWIEQQWHWLTWIGWLLWPLFFTIAATLVFFCFAVLANLIAAPFNGLLAEAVEQFLRRQADEPRSGTGITGISIRLVVASVLNEIRKFLYIMARALPLLILFLIPVAQVLAPGIWILFGAWIMALEYMEFPLGNHGMEFHAVRSRIAANRALCMGFGLGVCLLTIIPVVNFVAMPVAVSGATKMYLEKLQHS